MKDFTKYKEDLKDELRSFYESSEEHNKTKRLSLTENRMDKFCKEYFDGVVFNSAEHREYVNINKSVYEDFVKQVEPSLEKPKNKQY